MGVFVEYGSYQKGYYPYLPDADEVDLLIATYQNLFVALRCLLEERIAVDFAKGEILLRRLILF